MEMPISRRQLLKLLAAGIGGVCLNKLYEGSGSRLLAEELDDPTLSTSVAAGVSATYPGRVIHVHSDQATSWAGQTDYWNYVNQAAVNDMVDQGVMALTNTTTVAAAWRTLLPNYRAGQKIAIKVNFNNSNWGACDVVDGQIDALIQPVNAVVRGLKQVGISEADIWICDPSRPIPQHFVSACQYGGVHYFDAECREYATWSSGDPNAFIAFSPPPGVATPPAVRVSDVLINATYLINMPIMKPHSIAGVTLAFKNHFGSIDQPSALHDYIRNGGLAVYNPLIDLYRNPHISGKTILTIGDGLFAAKVFYAAPRTWTTFGGAVPNSLFFATDPVAVDCVMCDFLAAEVSLHAMSDNYLKLAAQAGLGVYERGNPWGSGYSQIDYLKVSTPLPPTAPVLSISSSDNDVTLTWQHNNANTSYEVWRGASPSFTPGPGDTPIASGLPPSPNYTMAGDTITCTDPDAVAGASSCYYFVRALNMADAFEDSNRIGVFSFAL